MTYKLAYIVTVVSYSGKLLLLSVIGENVVNIANIGVNTWWLEDTQNNYFQSNDSQYNDARCNDTEHNGT